MSDKTGGHAFPVPAGDYNGSKSGNGYRAGMTLRDYFAAAAMQALIVARATELVDESGSPVSDTDLAEQDYIHSRWVSVDAYLMADYMLETREAHHD